MLRIAFLVTAVLVVALLASLAFALILMALATLLLLAAIALPVWLMSRPYLQRHGLARRRQTPIERLKQLYAEGQIDMFEFEHRVRSAIALEH